MNVELPELVANPVTTFMPKARDSEHCIALLPTPCPPPLLSKPPSLPHPTPSHPISPITLHNNSAPDSVAHVRFNKATQTTTSRLASSLHVAQATNAANRHAVPWHNKEPWFPSHALRMQSATRCMIHRSVLTGLGFRMVVAVGG
ncbi:hypothetical protein IQ07DRAFT_671655 [Pyrenochaeta sp. DS3sAY3a]|nr:hypothetical protein IQ07DRAFT_671655 [Pyrenochaeta sp. DS3sAY3a]